MPRRKKASASTSAHGTTISAVSQASAGAISREERSLIWDTIAVPHSTIDGGSPPSIVISDFEAAYCAALISLTILE